ncbi:hypothetical protein Tco_0892599 [Tanacetum coccineum]|uniref:Uncharacterized protein n=1 Tax=Tanacetum coccineum TaxID=301880 RepID=A0ABQ5C9B9_9ASTR
MNSKARRALFTTPRTVKSKVLDAIPIVAKTRYGSFFSRLLDVQSYFHKVMVMALKALAPELWKNKKSSHPPKMVPSTHSKLELIHMDLCRPMKVESINGKRHILDTDSSAEDTSIPSKEDLDNLFGPMYEEYFEKRSPKVSINSVAQTTLNNHETSSSSSIIVEDNEAPPLVSSSEEQISPISRLMN